MVEEENKSPPCNPPSLQKKHRRAGTACMAKIADGNVILGDGALAALLAPTEHVEAFAPTPRPKHIRTHRKSNASINLATQLSIELEDDVKRSVVAPRTDPAPPAVSAPRRPSKHRRDNTTMDWTELLMEKGVAGEDLFADDLDALLLSLDHGTPNEKHPLLREPKVAANEKKSARRRGVMDVAELLELKEDKLVDAVSNSGSVNKLAAAAAAAADVVTMVSLLDDAAEAVHPLLRETKAMASKMRHQKKPTHHRNNSIVDFSDFTKMMLEEEDKLVGAVSKSGSANKLAADVVTMVSLLDDGAEDVHPLLRETKTEAPNKRHQKKPTHHRSNSIIDFSDFTKMMLEEEEEDNAQKAAAKDVPKVLFSYDGERKNGTRNLQQHVAKNLASSAVPEKVSPTSLRRKLKMPELPTIPEDVECLIPGKSTTSQRPRVLKEEEEEEWHVPTILEKRESGIAGFDVGESGIGDEGRDEDSRRRGVKEVERERE